MHTRREWMIGVGALGMSRLMRAAPIADWSQFRGPDRTNSSKETGLLHHWPAAGPKRLWSVPVEQGYAGAAVVAGRVYHQDYDLKKSQILMNCRSLADGKLVWQYAEDREIRANHAITRTVPAVDSRFVISLDPKAVLTCLDVKTGKLVWRKSLVTEYKATIPSWYNGQNPLQEADRIIIGTGGTAILAALDKATGKEIWKTPNPANLQLSHSSVMPAVLGGVKQYLWGTLAGPLGVAASDGKLLWQHARKFNVVIPPSPLAVNDELVFLTGPYDAGSVMVRVRKVGAEFKTESVFDLKSTDWNSEVHTPIVYQGHMFAVGKKRRGLFTCLGFDGKEVWTSEGKATFGLGGFLLADGMFFAMDGDSGKLHLIEANTTGYKELASAQVLSGEEVWGPLALYDGKLVLRDLTQMVCVDVRG